MKKVISLIVILTLVMCSFCSSFASEKEESELVNVNGEIIEYVYDFSEEEISKTTIINHTKNEVHLLVFNKAEGVFYLDSVEFASVLYFNGNNVVNSVLSANDIWIYDGWYETNIQWPQSTTTYVLAAIIANVVNPVSAATVLLKIGATVLSNMAKTGGSGKVTNYMYHANGDGSTMYKYHWKFDNNNGNSYGWYDTYIQI